MSYNNIGLTTPRGSGTSGYIQRNLSHPRQTDELRPNPNHERYQDRPSSHRQPDRSILEHERKRRIENRCVELRLELENQAIEDEESIDRSVDELRQRLLREDLEDSSGSRRNLGPLKPHESHEIAAMKLEENEKLRTALKVDGSYVEGQAFDRELQAERKALRAERKAQAIEERQRRTADRPTRPAPQSRVGSRFRDGKPYQKPPPPPTS